MGRRPYNSRQRDTERRGILAAAMSRTIAQAEGHRDRARAGILRLEGEIADLEALGLSAESELAHLARLRIALASAEADLTAACRAFGMDRAA